MPHFKNVSRHTLDYGVPLGHPVELSGIFRENARYEHMGYGRMALTVCFHVADCSARVERAFTPLFIPPKCGLERLNNSGCYGSFHVLLRSGT